MGPTAGHGGVTYVVLRGNGVVVVRVQEGNLAEDVAVDTGDIAEEEHGEGAGGDTEGTSKGTTKRRLVRNVWTRPLRGP